MPIRSSIQSNYDTKALSSIAAPVTDDWTDPANPFDADGGGRQYFVPEKGNMAQRSI
jgi:hypothetical protein